ncbi:hypothetical protein [Alicyclobacillus sp. ALC3]|uniref:hypothetical protein n=1 Tax=Alicyclobacillus sp. ALC3 TaxID=2796143 RepID=UPI0023780123|nr:hypothetical protein [Alicyclobacillus sp. ALC3]WDL98032.1 hypothetical protein JC200_04820 [Alicyclobacillus sp. ALC3]
MGVGFIFIVVLLAVLIGLFARQALANVGTASELKVESEQEHHDTDDQPHAM